mgnify:CR=1 FL=1
MAISTPDALVDALAESLGVAREEEAVPEEIAIFEEVRTTGLARDHLIGSGPELEPKIGFFGTFRLSGINNDQLGAALNRNFGNVLDDRGQTS